MSAADQFGNTPCDYVGALVCHYSRHIRETRLLLMLHAYFDDSRQDEKAGTQGVYTLAGYVGHAAKWKDFTDAWDRALHAQPRQLDYLKTWQAYKLRDPESMFYGWSEKERDERLTSLARTGVFTGLQTEVFHRRIYRPAGRIAGQLRAACHERQVARHLLQAGAG